MQINHEDVTEGTRPQPASPSLRVAMWEAPDAPGPVLTLRGGLTGWDSFYRIRDVVKKAFSQLPKSRALALNLCELEAADPLCLSMLAHMLTTGLSRGAHFRLVTPSGPWAEYILPRLLVNRPPHRVHRIAEYPAIVVDM